MSEDRFTTRPFGFKDAQFNSEEIRAAVHGIDYGFNFSESREGHEYWKRIALRLREIASITPSPYVPPISIGGNEVKPDGPGAVKVGCTRVTREEVERVLAMMPKEEEPKAFEDDGGRKQFYSDFHACGCGKSSTRGYKCTRPGGHAGMHEAMAGRMACARWPQAPATPDATTPNAT